MLNGILDCMQAAQAGPTPSYAFACASLLAKVWCPRLKPPSVPNQMEIFPSHISVHM